MVAQTVMLEEAVQLELRLARGAELLFDMECRGETGTDYDRWLERWMALLLQYEGSRA